MSFLEPPSKLRRRPRKNNTGRRASFSAFGLERPDLDVTMISTADSIEVDTPEDQAIFEDFGGSLDDGSLNLNLDDIDDEELLG